MAFLMAAATGSPALELPAGPLANLASEQFHQRESAQAELLAWARQQPDTVKDELLRHSRNDSEPEVRERCLQVLRDLINEEYLQDGEGFLGIQMGNALILGLQGLQPAAQDETALVPGDPVRRKTVKVTMVVADSAAEHAGLQPNDQIVQMGDLFWHQGDPGDAATLLREHIRQLKPNTKVSFKILRDDKLLDIEVKLGRRPLNADRMLFGDNQFDEAAAEQTAKDAYFKRWLDQRISRK